VLQIYLLITLVICFIKSSNWVAAFVGTPSSGGTSISWGSKQTVATGLNSQRDLMCAYDSTNDRVVFHWVSYVGSSYTSYCKVASISGSTLTFGSQVAVSGIRMLTGPGMAHNPEDGKMYFVFREQNGTYQGKLMGVIGTVSGTSISFGSIVQSPGTQSVKSSAYCHVVYHPEIKRCVFWWLNNSDEIPYAGTANVSGTTFVFETNMGALTNYACDKYSGDMPLYADYNSDKKIIIGCTQKNSTKYGVLLTSDHGAASSNSNKFIGFSSAGYTNGQTATINVVGNTTTQSSLTPGTTYYIQDNGTLGTSAGSNSVIGGIALTSTKLLIRPA